MKSIQSILQTEGIEFMDALMNDYLTVYEKLNASTLSFRRVGDELKFYKGRDNEEITKMNEALYSYFRDGIEYLRRVSLIFYMEFPEGWLFRTQYFNPNAPGLVEYQDSPKNNLVLSCIDTGNSVVEDLTVLRRWADRLQIDVSEPVFSGFLSEFQKEKLMDYVEGRCECDVPFSQYIIGILNPAVSHSAFCGTFNANIDSFIFKFYKAGSKKCVALKLSDPYMEQIMKQNRDKFGANTGTENEIILANFVAWMQTVDLNDIDIDGDDSGERYFDLLCKLFNMYMEKEHGLFRGIKSDINESYKVNIDNIKNEETAKLLKDNPHLSTAFQIIVGSFMNKKDIESDPSSIMDDNMRELFNSEVKSIKRLTDDKDDQVKSFTELMKSAAETSNDTDDDGKVLSFSELMDKIGKRADDETENTEADIPSGSGETENRSDDKNKNGGDSGESGETEKEDGTEKNTGDTETGGHNAVSNEKPKNDDTDKKETAEKNDDEEKPDAENKPEKDESDEDKPDENESDEDKSDNGTGDGKDENEDGEQEKDADGGSDDSEGDSSDESGKTGGEKNDDAEHDDNGEKRESAEKPDNSDKTPEKTEHDIKRESDADGKPEEKEEKHSEEARTVKEDNPEKTAPVPEKTQKKTESETNDKPEKKRKEPESKPEPDNDNGSVAL